MSSTTTVTETPTLATVAQQPEITAENVLRLFPEVNTDLIGGSHNSATNDHALDGYDEEQIRLMDEVCIVLDNNDIPIGSATKKLCECARGRGGGGVAMLQSMHDCTAPLRYN
jgi:isopentenyl-diphosphate delta-isomerase